MARLLNATGQNISVAASVTVVDNFTMGGWFFVNSVGVGSDCVFFNGNTAANGYGIFVEWNGATGETRVVYGAGAIYGGGALTPNEWVHLVLRRLSGTGQLFKGGATFGASNGTAPGAPSGNFEVSLAVFSTLRSFRVAEPFICDVALSNNEITAIGRGEKISQLRRPNLKTHWPLWGIASPEPDLSGNGKHGTVTGASRIDHAPVGRYVPRRAYAQGISPILPPPIQSRISIAQP